jgi:hypothetical protein
MKRMLRHFRLLPLLLVFWSVTAAAESPLAGEMAAVEKIRGLKFKHDVVVTTIGRDEIKERVRAEMRRQMPYPVDDYIGVLRALQLVDGSSNDLTDKLLALYEAQVLAYYDPAKHTYFDIRELPDAVKDAASPELLKKSVAIHELTHAMQDQYFDIGTKDDALKDDWDGQLAYHSVIEGEASLVMIGWMLGEAGQPLDAVMKNDMLVNAMTEGAAADKTIDPSSPRYFVESLKFPYLDGLKFVIAAYRRGGWKELDRIDANPPRTTREILHPEEYFERTFKPRAFDGHEPPNTLTVEHLGEFHWRFLVGAEHVQGWVDDHVTVTCDDRVIAETAWDTAAHAGGFRDAYVAFLRDRGIEPQSSVDGLKVRVSYGVTQ